MSTRQAMMAFAAVGAIALGIVVWHFATGPDPTDELSSTDPDKQAQAFAKLGASAGSAKGIQRIAKAARSEDLSVACGAIRSLVVGAVPDKPLPKEAVKVAEDGTKDSRAPVQVTSIQVLEVTTPPLPEDPTVPAIVLRTFVEAKTPEVRVAAANALAKFQYWEAMEPLINAMEDPSVEVRSACGMAVRKILGLDYGYHADDPPSQRNAVVARIRSQWKAQLPFHRDYAKRVHEARKAQP